MIGRICMMTLGALVALLMATTTGPAAPVAAEVAARLIGKLGKTPYEQYQVTDTLGRDVTFFLAEAPRPPATKESPSEPPQTPPAAEPPAVPLVVFVQGSGASSHFIKVGEKIGTTSGFPVIHDALRGRGRVMVVEKPGIRTFDQPSTPGGTDGASAEFRSEHTLDRWATAIECSIDAALKLPGIDPSRVMVIGHSEGGLVACRVAAMDPRITHVAVMAGGGPTQLYDFMHMARHGGMFDHVSSDPAQRVTWLQNQWATVMADPDSPDKIWFGHPHRRWSTFCATSPAEELLKCTAKVYIAQGGRDTAVEPSTADVLAATLLSRGRDVTLNWIDQGDHGFMDPPPVGAPAPAPSKNDGWARTFSSAVEWFLAP